MMPGIGMLGTLKRCESGIENMKDYKVDADFIVNFVGEKAVGTASLRSWLRDIGECQNSIREFKGKLGSQVHEKSLVQRRQSSS